MAGAVTRRTTPLIDLKTVDDLDRLLSTAGTDPVVVYKHSLTCGTSGLAFEEIRELAAGGRASTRIGVIMVQSARDVSNEVARRFGVRHESPQVLLIRDGRVVWQASHFRVTADGIADALEKSAAASRPDELT
jgi:bacillithiol system protein YtxJ